MTSRTRFLLHMAEAHGIAIFDALDASKGWLQREHGRIQKVEGKCPWRV